MQFDDHTLRRLLDAYHATHPETPEPESPEHKLCADDLFAWMKAYFDQVLRPLLARQFPATAEDTSVRYSAMVNEFFVSVLNQRADAVWQARTLEALRRVATRVIKNDILDVLRRRRGTRGTSEERDTPEAYQASADLAEERAEHFHLKHGLDLEPCLELLERWRQLGPPWDQRARVVEGRYIMGMTYDELATQEGTTTKNVYRIMAAALEALRAQMNEASRP